MTMLDHSKSGYGPCKLVVLVKGSKRRSLTNFNWGDFMGTAVSVSPGFQYTIKKSFLDQINHILQY